METRDKPLWETALKFGPQILRKVIDAGVPKNTVINVNFPACAPEEVRGVRVTRQGKRNLGFLKVDKRQRRPRQSLFLDRLRTRGDAGHAGRRHRSRRTCGALCFGDAAAARPHRRSVFGSADGDAEVGDRAQPSYPRRRVIQYGAASRL